MTIGQLRDRLPTLPEDEREVARDLFYLLTPASGQTIMAFQRAWDGKRRPFSEFVVAQNELIIKLIDAEISPGGSELRKMLGMPPITLETEIVTHVPLDQTKPHFRMIQCLCGPARHAIMGIGYEWPEVAKEEALASLKAAMKEMKVDPWCVICRSMDFRFEDVATRWKTKEEAAPHLAQQQLENLLTNLHFHQVKNN